MNLKKVSVSIELRMPVRVKFQNDELPDRTREAIDRNADHASRSHWLINAARTSSHLCDTYGSYTRYVITLGFRSFRTTATSDPSFYRGTVNQMRRR
jgi:hypothetical protein